MKLDVRTILLLSHQNKNELLLLKRHASKKLFPDLMTGIGGKVELERGEGEQLIESMWREFKEETNIPKEITNNVKLRLTTIHKRSNLLINLLWFTGDLTETPDNLSCTEGTLHFISKDNLPKKQMIPTAYEAIHFICRLPDSDENYYNGCFQIEEGRGVKLHIHKN